MYNSILTALSEICRWIKNIISIDVFEKKTSQSTSNMDKLRNLMTKLGIDYNDEDVNKIKNDIDLLKKCSLSSITERLLQSTKKPNFLTTLTELKITSSIIDGTSINQPLKIEYEPKDYNKPPDLKININGITFYIQIKSAARIEKDNRRGKIIKLIQKKSETIPINKSFEILFEENFNDSEVDSLIDFIKSNAEKTNEEMKIKFIGYDNSLKATITISSQNAIKFQHLTLYSSVNLYVENETDLARYQLISSLQKASEAFEWDTSDNQINLIAIELAQPDSDIDITEALYGKEVFRLAPKTGMAWNRDESGFFYSGLYSMKTAGVIAMQRKDPNKLSSEYWKVLCINERNSYLQNEIAALFNVDKIIDSNELPENNGGFFDLKI